MNHIYRSLWNASTGTVTAVSEHAKSRGKKNVGGKRAVVRPSFIAQAVAAALALSCGSAAYASPTGGAVVAGHASISSESGHTTIQQSTQNAALTWQSFDVGVNESVRFVQPDSNSVALNRVLGSDPSSILGSLSANGKVFLVNPNGILFGTGAQVNVGALVASTRDIADSDFLAGRYEFSGASNGGVVNQGSIHADGGYVALLGANVSNQGIIAARLGTVALAAGNAFTLDVAGDGLLNVAINAGAIGALAGNGGVIQADGGHVLMTARSASSLLQSAVNNTGLIQAQTIENRNGTIKLLGDMHSGTVNVGGTLDASAPTAGDGGFIDTSAAHVSVANDMQVTTAAARGLTGSWLIDPTDYTIAASGGDITGALLSSTLASTNVTIQSMAGATDAAGDVNVNDTVTWSANRLTLNAQNNININTAMHASGTASLALEYGQGAAAAGNTSTVNVNAPVNLPAGNNFSTLQGSDGAVVNYTVITSLGAEGSVTGADLQGVNGDVDANYVLGSNIDATAANTWNAGAGFAPIMRTIVTTIDYEWGSYDDITYIPFTGVFDGLGHTIANLTIYRPSSTNVGLFGLTDIGSLIRNVGLIGNSVTGSMDVGALVGNNSASISNAYASGSVASTYDNLGGLVGSNFGSINNSYASGSVTGVRGEYTGVQSAGGLVGYSTGAINNSHASASVQGYNFVGGLVGFNDATLSSSYATGNVSGANTVGGLVGLNNGPISYSYATGDASGTSSIGGLLGYNNHAVSHTYASGKVFASNTFGGLVGASRDNTVSNSYWNSTLNSVGSGRGTVIGVTGLTDAQMQTAANFSIFNFTTTPGVGGNNWVMVDVDGTLNNAGGAAGATRPMLASEYSTTITTAHQLQLMHMNLAASYTQARDINAATTGSATDVWSGSTFIPVGNSAAHFSGSFDGAGHTINALTINRPASSEVGLFGFIQSGSLVQNVGLVGGTVAGGVATGALVGQSMGTIRNSYATTNVTGGDYSGALVGYNMSLVIDSHATGTMTATGSGSGGLVGMNDGGTISNSYATGAVTGVGEGGVYGGLAGWNDRGTISNSYATGAVTGYSQVGGLVGMNEQGNGSAVIQTSYASGAVSGTSSLGGLVGLNNGTVNDSFWDITTSGQVNSAGGIGLTTEQMQSPGNFTGFNFTTTAGATGNNWVMVNFDGSLNNSSGGTRPMLASEYSTTIMNAHQLQLMRLDLAGSYTLGRNIDASATANSQGVWLSGSFVPVGKDNNRFTGTFDGLGHTIDNLRINLPGADLPTTNEIRESDQAGLFGYLGDAGVVQNVGLVGGSVVGRDFAGALVGRSGGTVTNSYATGNVQGRSYIGGLIGYNNASGSVSGSHAVGSVTGSLGNVGGLIGVNNGTLSGNYANGAVQGGEHQVGGLVGFSDSGGAISNSYASGSVTGVNGSSYVGGLVGKNSGDVLNSYASGEVQGFNYVGGLVGGNYGVITNTYSTGSVQSANAVGGLMSFNYGTVTRSFWNTQTSGQLSSSAGVGLTSAQMMQLSSFSSWNTATPNTIASTGSSGASWRIYEGQTAPLLTRFMTALTLVDDYATYDGTEHSGPSVVLDGVFGSTAGTNAGVYSLHSNQQGYDITGGSLIISRADLTLSGTRSYDGSTAFAGSGLTATGVAGESFAITGGGDASNLSSRNVQTGSELITVTGLALGASMNGGLSSNYNALSTAGSSVSVTQAALTLAAGNVVKTYDGSLTAAGSATVVAGTLFDSDALSGGVFAFTDKNAGDGDKTVTAAGVTVTDGNNGANYSVTYANNTTSTIDRAVLTTTVTAEDKVYDGNTTATATLGALAGLIDSETLIASGTATFNSKDVLDANLVTVNSVTLVDGTNGGLASNYTLAPGQSTAANITARALAATAAATDKIYDGNTTANAALSGLIGLVGSESLSAIGTASFNSKDVATANLVTVDSVSLSDGANGGLASNYSLASGQTAVAHITPQTLTAAVTASDKVYDGNTTATATLSALSGLVGSESLSAIGTASFNSKDVATANLVTVGSVSLIDGSNGGLASNYNLASGQTAVAHITRRVLTVVDQVALDKTYDGTTVATLRGGLLTGVIGGESVGLDEAGTFATAEVGNGIAVTAADSLSGADAANYVLTQPVGLAANITAAIQPEVPPVVVTPPVVVAPPVAYSSAVGNAVSNSRVASPTVGTTAPLIVSSGGSSSTGSTMTYDLAGLNLTVITSEGAMPALQSPGAADEDDKK
ncbi:YDG domain-containing protein [Povalibacter sp.]|uniref:YDG domain-containing protein n=1 Tax=Povalibacter sp. TaxID=1962978 RepID=UPI002F41E5E4